MLSSVLNTPMAVQVSVTIIRSFVQLREMLATHKDLARKLTALEKNYDKKFEVVFRAIKALMTPSKEPKKPPIGFRQK